MGISQVTQEFSSVYISVLAMAHATPFLTGNGSRSSESSAESTIRGILSPRSKNRPTCIICIYRSNCLTGIKIQRRPLFWAKLNLAYTKSNLIRDMLVEKLRVHFRSSFPHFFFSNINNSKLRTYHCLFIVVWDNLVHVSI